MADFAPSVGPYPKGSSHAAHTSDGSQQNYWKQMNETYTTPAHVGGSSGDPTPDQVYQYYGQYYDYSNQYGNYYYYQDPYGQHQRSQKQLTCDVCNRSFFSEAKLQQHIEGHVKCPFPECGLEADMKIIDQHITNQHMLVNFEALQMDDEAWRAERKKRFPTAERAAIRRAQQEQQLKRGERLQPNKKRFNKDAKPISKPKREDKDKREDKKKTSDDRSDTGQNKGRGKRGNWKKEENKNKFSKPAPVVDVDPYDSDPELKRGVPAFKGTKQYYESTGEVSYFVNYNRKVMEEEEEDLSEETMEDGLCISDEEEWQSAQTLESTGTAPKDGAKIVLSNALGSLIVAYDSDSEEEGNIESQSIQPGVAAKDVKHTTSAPTPCIPKEGGEVVKSNETPLDSRENKGRNTRRRQWRRKRHAKDDGSENADKGITNDSRPRPKQPRFPRRRKATLLEKLLESDIRHERNVILQCIRYIVNNNFFDSPEETVTEEEDKRKDEEQNSLALATKDHLEFEKRKDKGLDKGNMESNTTNILKSKNDVEDRMVVDNQNKENRVESANTGILEPERRKEESLCHNELEAKTRNLLENEDVESRMEVDHQTKRVSLESATLDQMENKSEKEECDQDNVEGKVALECENNVDKMGINDQSRKDTVELLTIDQMEYESGEEKSCDQDNVKDKITDPSKSENDVGNRFEMCNQNRKNITQSGTKCEDKKEISSDHNHSEEKIATLFKSENGVEDMMEVDDCNKNKRGALELST